MLVCTLALLSSGACAQDVELLNKPRSGTTSNTSPSIAPPTPKQAPTQTKTHTPAKAKSANNLYQLGIGDSLKITVFGEDDLSNTFHVGSNGTIAFPLIGDVKVQGLTIQAVETLIKRKLSDGYLINPSISIEVAKYRPFYIMGEVRAPGSYNYINGITALKAVALAGGFTYRANKKQIEILRTKKSDSELYQKVPVTTTISPGDIILVKERFF